MMHTALTIAGSDSIAGAGIQADLKTFAAHGVYGMSVITAVTAQNTCGVTAVEEISVKTVKEQIEAICSDIMPHAVKIGMVYSAEIIECIAASLNKLTKVPVVLDPIILSSSGHTLLKEEAVTALTKELFGKAALITPNLPEAGFLMGEDITTAQERSRAARFLSEKYGVSVLLKGGHGSGRADDLLYHEGKETWFYGEQIPSASTHGTGCTLSSAIAANLANGSTMEQAVRDAKEYINGAILHGIKLGKGHGPLNHFWR